MNQENNKEYGYPKFAPFKIEIERNVDLSKSNDFVTAPLFTVKVNGKKLENVKRFYIDLDSDKLRETIKFAGSRSIEVSLNPWTYGVEFFDDPEPDNF